MSEEYITDNKLTNNKMPLVILTGPTAVGKTEISIRLAKELNGEIISADSMQVYRHMDIGTAKIKREEMDGIPHHLINVLDPKDEFNVFLFQKMAKEALKTIYEHGKIPIIVGGTGFYIQALLYDIEFDENLTYTKNDMSDHNSYDKNLDHSGYDTNYREELTKYYEEYGASKLHEMLKSVDPLSYNTIHENNVKRVIRALEFYKENGYPISEHNREQRMKESPYNFTYFVLNQDRNVLYDRIEKRIDIMINEGLVDEVKWLLEYGCTPDMTSMQGLGYKEIIPYINGECSLDEAIYILKRDTRHFAKRQLTWFRRERDVTWVCKDELHDIEDQLQFILKNIN